MHPTTRSMAFTVLKPSNIFCLLILLLALYSPLSCKADNILYAGETLSSGKSLEYGSYKLTMNTDCDLVLYDNGTSVWSSGTKYLDRNCYCTMQTDGNFVIHRPAGGVIWETKTAREVASYVLILQKDGNLVIYGPDIWSTSTNAQNLGRIPAATVVNNIGGENTYTAPKLASVVGAIIN